MPVLHMQGLHKRFGGVIALDGAVLSCRRGEVHALIGANGSGKSTLNKVLTGVVRADAGEVNVRGESVAIAGPADMRRLRIAAVYQELSLVPQMSVADNVLLSAEPVSRFGFVRRRELLARARVWAERFEAALGRTFDLHETVENLSPSDRQLVEIMKALSREPDILILDEATASLHQKEVGALFDIVKELRDDGKLIIFVSHRMGEVFELCDRATVLRNGRTVGTVTLAEVTEADLVRMMVGDVEAMSRRQADVDWDGRPTVLRVEGLHGGRLQDVSFALRAGEVVGLGGLQGQGQSELLRTLFGVQPFREGRVEIDGRPVALRNPRRAMAAGIAYIPGDRGREGLFLQRPILENITFTSLASRSRGGLLRPGAERRAAAGIVKDLLIKIGHLSDPVYTLSGGNQQKVVVGKWLLNEPRVLLMDDPTKGVDIGAKAEIYELIDRLTDAGVAVVLNSSENMELLNVSDRVLVMYEGRIVAELAGAELTEDRLVSASLRIADPAGATGKGAAQWT